MSMTKKAGLIMRLILLITVPGLLLCSDAPAFPAATTAPAGENFAEDIMHWPVEGEMGEDYLISSYYGYRKFHGTGWHSGLDIATVGGKDKQILAAGSGEVIFAGELRGYGNTVMIRHCEEIVTLYAHMVSADEVEPGDKVERGEPIGRAGKTGDATGVHLHFEVWLNGIPRDPLPYLGMESVPPLNDNFSAAIPFNDYGNVVRVRGTNDGAGREEGEPVHGDIPGGRSVWWLWNAPREGLFFFRTENCDFNTTLGVYTGDSLTELVTAASDGDAGGDVRSLFHARADKEYKIAVDGAGGASGFFYLTLGEVLRGSVTGIVTDTETGHPVPEALITAVSRDYRYQAQTISSKDGSYYLCHIPPGINDITVSHRNYESPEAKATRVAAEEITVTDFITAPKIPGPGNVTGEDGITVVDAIWILRHIVGLQELTPEQQQRAKVSGGDTVNILDAILILRYITGIIDDFPL